MQQVNRVIIEPPYIKLEQFLKLGNIAASGGEAKLRIQGGDVYLNGEPCLERGRKLFGGERIALKGEDGIYEVVKKA